MADDWVLPPEDANTVGIGGAAPGVGSIPAAPTDTPLSTPENVMSQVGQPQTTTDRAGNTITYSIDANGVMTILNTVPAGQGAPGIAQGAPSEAPAPGSGAGTNDWVDESGNPVMENAPLAIGPTGQEDIANANPPPADEFLSAVVGHPLAAPGVSALDRFHIGQVEGTGSPQDIANMQKRWKKLHPEGDLLQVPIPSDLNYQNAGSTVLLARTAPNEPYSRVDAPGLTGGDAMQWLGANRTEMAGTILGGALAHTASWIGRAAYTAFGGALGKALGIGGNQLSGYPQHDALAQIGMSLGTNFIGSLVGDAIGAGVKIPLRGISNANPAALAADRAGQALGLAPLYSFQMAEAPALKRAAGQSMQEIATLGRKVRDQLIRINELLPRGRSVPLQDALATLSQYNSEAERSVDFALRPRTDMDPMRYGQQFVDALDTWGYTSQQLVSREYDYARSLGEPIFDIGELKSQAGAALGAAQGNAAYYSPELSNALQRVMQLPDRFSSIRVPSANPGESVIMSGEEVLNGIRSQLFDAATPRVVGAPATRNTTDMALASWMRSAVTRVRDNPVNIADLPPDFARAWHRAGQSAERRFSQLEQWDYLFPVMQRTFEPSATVEKIWNGGSHEAIQSVYHRLQSIGMGDRWTLIADGLRRKIADMVMLPDRGTADRALAALGRFEPDDMRLFMNDSQLAGVRQAIEGHRILENLDIPSIMQQETTATGAVMALMKNGNKAGIADLYQTASPDLRNVIRIGLLDHLSDIRKTLKMEGPLKGQEILDGPAIERELMRWDDNGISRFLEPGDRELLRVVIDQMRFVDPQGDTGTSIAAATLGGHMIKAVFSHEERVALVQKLLDAMTFGRLVSSGVGRSLILGLRPTTVVRTDAKLAIIGAIWAETAKEMQIEQRVGTNGELLGALGHVISGPVNLYNRAVGKSAE